MASVTLDKLSKIYPNGFVSVKDVSLQIKDGEFITFYGPHGCGKSTILRMIGGLEEITSGRVLFGEDVISEMIPPNRPLAMAFQNYLLYGNMNAAANISIGLRMRKLPKNMIDSRVHEAADFLGITHLLHKKIKHLSEADKQQVALGRALVCKPAVLLVDEEFAHADANRRREMIHDMQKIRKHLEITILYVTNNYHEAVTVGDRVVFMDEGEIIEVKETHHFTPEAHFGHGVTDW